MSRTILLLPGDGIGPEIMGEAEKVLRWVNESFKLDLSFQHGLVCGAALDDSCLLSSSDAADDILCVSFAGRGVT